MLVIVVPHLLVIPEIVVVVFSSFLPFCHHGGGGGGGAGGAGGGCGCGCGCGVVLAVVVLAVVVPDCMFLVDAVCTICTC